MYIEKERDDFYKKTSGNVLVIKRHVQEVDLKSSKTTRRKKVLCILFDFKTNVFLI